jgi:hypothetical protein
MPAHWQHSAPVDEILAAAVRVFGLRSPRSARRTADGGLSPHLPLAPRPLSRIRPRLSLSFFSRFLPSLASAVVAEGDLPSVAQNLGSKGFIRKSCGIRSSQHRFQARYLPGMDSDLAAPLDCALSVCSVKVFVTPRRFFCLENCGNLEWRLGHSAILVPRRCSLSRLPASA